MINKNSKLMRVPPCFENWVDKIKEDLTEQTGIPHKRTDVLRKLSLSRLTPKKGKIDWRLL